MVCQQLNTFKQKKKGERTKIGFMKSNEMDSVSLVDKNIHLKDVLARLGHVPFPATVNLGSAPLRNACLAGSY